MPPALDRDQSSVFEYERLQRLAELLGIQNAVTAYEYLKEGEREGIKGWRKFEELPATQITSEAERRRAEKNRIKGLRASLLKSGVLLFSDEQKARGVTAISCAAGDGLVIAKPDYMSQTLTVVQLRKPWTAVEPLSIESPAHVTAAVSDADAKRVVFAAGDRVRIWDISTDVWQHLLDIPEADLAVGAAISPDGKIVAHASRNEIVLTEIPSGRCLFRTPARGGQRQMAFDPSGKWLAVAGNMLGIISMSDGPRQRDIFVGGKSAAGAFASAALKQKLKTIDLDKLEKDKRSSFEQQLKAMESQLGKAKTPAFSNEQIEQARQVMEKSITTMLAQLRAAKSGEAGETPGVAATSNEHVMCVGFSRDGRWFYCGTNLGIRVYDWKSFPREAGSSTPPPTWHYSPMSGGSHDSDRQINAIVEEADGSGLVFAGWAGAVLRIDLNNGEVRSLISIPGGGGVWSLVMSGDGGVLAVSSQFSSRLNEGSLLPDSVAFELWAYQRLRDGATKLQQSTES